MVNKTLLPPPRPPGETSKPFQNMHFPTWHGFRSVCSRTAGLGEPFRFEKWIRGTSLGGQRLRIIWRGEPPMENTLLIGLSRQMTLERQMDVVANNVANVNTTGYKADRSMFQEYLASGAHEDNFLAADRRL